MRNPTKRNRLLVLIAAAVAAAFVISACGGSDDGSAEPAGVDDAVEPVAVTTGTADAPSALTVDMGEWFFETDSETIKAGKVEVTAANVGEVDHELIAVKTDLPADDLPVTPEGGLEGDMAGDVVIGKPHGHGDGDEGAGHDEGDEGADGDEGAGHDNSDGHHDDDADADASDKDAANGKSDKASKDEAVEGHVMPGDSITFEVDLEPGSYVLLCTIPGHYAAGQDVSLTVVE